VSTEAPGELGFDRAADFYDATRDLDPAARERLTDVLVAEVRGMQTLEVGIGTGLVGLALARRGVPMSGIDLSPRMLDKLVEKFQTPDEVRLRQGSATDLPYADQSFDAVLTSQMLHLVDDWRTALDELRRVVRPAGKILIDLGNEPDSGWGGPWSQVARQFWTYAAPQGRRSPEVWSGNVVADDMAAPGWQVRALDRVLAFEDLSLADIITRLERGLWSACWSLPNEVVTDAARRTRAWAKHQYGDLDRSQRIERTVAWRAFRLSGGESEIDD
jgi:SAM-dependent methyltransferase